MKYRCLKILAAFLALALLFPLNVSAAQVPLCGCPQGTEGAFEAGRGSEQNPFRVTSAAQLRHMEVHPDMHFRLDKSLRISGGWEPLCSETPFTGSLDGRGRGLTLTAPLFDKVGETGYISRLTLKGEISVGAGTLYTGFAARENEGWLCDILVKGSITIASEASPQAAVGGIAGKNSGLIDSCDFAGTIRDQRSSGAPVGAMAGENAPDHTGELPAMITAHSGFAAERGASDKREDNTIDNIIKSICLGPDAIEVDVRIYTDPQGNRIPVLAHDKDMVGPDCVTVEDVLKLLMGDHPRSGELTENYKTILIQLDQKETAVAEYVFPLIERLGFPLERVIFPVGTPGTLGENLRFWQDLSEKGLQIWVTPDPTYYSQMPAYINRLKGLQIPVVVNMSFGDATPEKIGQLKEHGFGVSIWTLNTHADLVENMGLGAFNVTSRLEEALYVREGLRTGILGCSWDKGLSAIGTGTPAPHGADPLPQPRNGDPVWIVPAVIGLLAAISAFFTFRKKRKNK